MKQEDIKKLKPFTLIVGAISSLIIIVLMISSGDTSLFGIKVREVLVEYLTALIEEQLQASGCLIIRVLMIILSWFPYFIIKIIEVYGAK